MKLKLNWESALLALLIVEILLFGALNPRMLDLNMLLLHQRLYLHRHRRAAADAGDHQRRDRYFAGLDHRPVRHRPRGDDPGGLAAVARGIADVALGTAVRVIQRRADPLHRHQPAGDHACTLYLYGGGALLLSGMAGATGYEGWRFPDSFTAFANLTLAGLPLPLVLFAIITFSSGC